MTAKKLPDAEFELMKAIWKGDEPVCSPELTDRLKSLLPHKDWMPQTVLTMLVRLEKKGYLRSEKLGRERCYFTAVSEREYMKIERESIKQRFSSLSVSGLVKSLYEGESISEDEINELKKWLDSM